MNTPKWISALFVFSAFYDGLLGLLFLVTPASLFRACAVTPPNHWGYVQFQAALLLIFALLFVQIARRPAANRELIPYGVLLKVAYCGVSAAHWLTTDIPWMWKPFTIIDLVMGILFVWAYVAIGKAEA